MDVGANKVEIRCIKLYKSWTIKINKKLLTREKFVCEKNKETKYAWHCKKLFQLRESYSSFP